MNPKYFAKVQPFRYGFLPISSKEFWSTEKNLSEGTFLCMEKEEDAASASVSSSAWAASSVSLDVGVGLLRSLLSLSEHSWSSIWKPTKVTSSLFTPWCTFFRVQSRLRAVHRYNRVLILTLQKIGKGHSRLFIRCLIPSFTLCHAWFLDRLNDQFEL